MHVTRGGLTPEHASARSLRRTVRACARKTLAGECNCDTGSASHASAILLAFVHSRWAVAWATADRRKSERSKITSHRPTSQHEPQTKARQNPIHKIGFTRDMSAR
jgi:hypothetical protein